MQVEIEERLKIINPDKVSISLELAGLGSRALASILDSLIKAMVMIIVGILGVVFFALGDRLASLEEAATGWTVALFLIFTVLFLAGYGALFELVWNGQTPGKRWSKIRVVMENGQGVTVMAVMIRNILRLVDSLPANYLLGGTLVFFSSKNQRLGDLLAGTVVIREQKMDIHHLSPALPAELNGRGDVESLLDLQRG
ncbi:hypothetical protein DCMF_11855 [Candidatus Formimonas warabiya]|uniref:RDD domain-containing protein n=2 Tax=Formimonas warabiya TaxID=1761012 RepID=A0A3G1KSH1_FORW1|nr:hypothetical protein DCMF_11855 [Candidatus Formimonas warabiya]